MAFRLYVVPAIGTGSDPDDARRPKYISALNPPGGYWDYGFQPTFLCGVDLQPADDLSVAAQADVAVFPFNLDASISGGEVNAFANKLEARFLPADYITGGMGWRPIAKSTAGIVRFMRRLRGFIGNVILFDGTSNKTLNVQWSSISVPIQDGILAAAAFDSLDTSFIQPSTSVRAMFKNLADQSQKFTFEFGPFSL